MAVSTYNAIGSVTLSAGQKQISFTNIPQIYTDLVLIASVQATTATDGYTLIVNGDTSSNYSFTRLSANGTTALSNRYSSQPSFQIADYTPNGTYFMPVTVNLMNYSNNTTYKSITSQYGAVSSNWSGNNICLWRNTSAITSITLKAGSNDNTKTGATFSLYGVGANQLKASGGDIIVSDGTYWYHAFKTSGVFTPNSSLTCDILRISGGGGGGYNLSGGGGAGGIVLSSSQSLTASAYTATVGAGGTGSTAYGTIGGIGGQTTFTGSGLSLSTVYPGGGGRGDYGPTYASASTVASNGGANGASTNSGGTTTTGQGNAGGSNSSGFYNAAGGGGAGAVGANSTSTSGIGGAGGAGINTYSSWATVTGTGISGYYAGGGGGCGMKTGSGTGAIGGLGGAGGGGQGGSDNGTTGTNFMLAMAAIPNTGSGGGGGAWDGYSVAHAHGANGGSGLVIVRYAV